MTPPTAAAVAGAADRIAPFARRTRTLRADALDDLVGARVVCKCEHEQVTGSFKYRGATNAVRSLPDDVAERGVATHSSGNHGQALAAAAGARGIPCHVVMPRDSARVKLQAVRAAGAELTLCEPGMAARTAGLAQVVDRTGATPIHPFEDPRVIAGQGTAARELLQEHPDVDMVLTPVGGGGLIGGSALGAHAHDPAIAIVGAEPAGARDAHDSLASGVRVTHHVPRTICDGLRGTVGEVNLALMRAHGVRIVLVDDADTAAAMRLARELLGIVIEPSAAITLAALRTHGALFRDRSVGVILSGGNLDDAPAR